MDITPEDLVTIITLIRNAGGALSDDDAVYHDQELELLVPALARVFIKYDDPNKAMIQIFDAITRFVDDPDSIPGVYFHPEAFR